MHNYSTRVTDLVLRSSDASGLKPDDCVRELSLVQIYDVAGG